MNRITQRKGDIAVTQAIATFTKCNFDVALPVTESAPYDLIVDVQRKLLRVQCKYSSNKCVDLRCIHSNSNGYVVKYYDKAFDLLYVYTPEGKEYIVQDDLSGRRSVNLQEKYVITRWLSGMDEDSGLNPPASDELVQSSIL